MSGVCIGFAYGAVPDGGCQRVCQDLNIQVSLSCRLEPSTAPTTQAEIRRIIDDLGLTGQVRVES